jgi:hypothetical protein
MKRPNHPAAGNAAFARGLTIGRRWRGVLEPFRADNLLKHDT